MKKTIYYINGNWVSSEKAFIPFNDAGFLYGDGLFETIRFDNRKLFLPEKHLSRLINGTKIINLSIPLNRIELLNLLNKIISKNILDSGIIRIMVTRGSMKSLNTKIIPNIYLNIKPFYKIPKGPVKVIYLNENNYPIIRFTPAIKSMNYIGNMLAKQHTENAGAFEPIFFNSDHNITECAIRNIFYIKNHELFTPTLNLGILPGVMRETIINIASETDSKDTHQFDF